VVTQAQIKAFIEEMRRAADGADEWSERWERLQKDTNPSLSLCLSLICWSFITLALAVHSLVRPITQPLHVGDRVRLTSNYQGKQFHAGDTGIVVDVVPAATPQGTPVYQVRLDAGHATVPPTFHHDELERV